MQSESRPNEISDTAVGRRAAARKRLGLVLLGVTAVERAWVARRPHIVDALAAAVALVAVDEARGAVLRLCALDAALSTDSERRWFDRVVHPAVLPTVFRSLLVEGTADDAIAIARAASLDGVDDDREVAP